MTVLTDNGYELMIQDYHAFEPGTNVGLLVKPEDIQVMKKERLCNTFDGEVLEDNRVRFLDEEWDIPERVAERFEVGEEVEVEVDFNRVNLQDDEEDGTYLQTVTERLDLLLLLALRTDHHKVHNSNNNHKHKERTHHTATLCSCCIQKYHNIRF